MFKITGYVEPNFIDVKDTKHRQYLQENEVWESDKTGKAVPWVATKEEHTRTQAAVEHDKYHRITDPDKIASLWLEEENQAWLEETKEIRDMGDCKLTPWTHWGSCTRSCGSA